MDGRRGCSRDELTVIGAPGERPETTADPGGIEPHRLDRIELRGLDRIELRGLSAHGHHGVLASERATGQTFDADVTLHVDVRAAAARDDLAATVNYAVVAEQAVAVLAGPPVDLIETLAEQIAAAALAHRGVRAVDVSVHKPQAPIQVPFGSVSVTVRRSASGDPDPGAPAHEELSHEMPARPVSAAGGDVGAHDASAERTSGGERDADVAKDRGPAAGDVVLALGGNLGDATHTMSRAVAALDQAPGVQVRAISPLMCGPAHVLPGSPPQPDYHNAVVIVHTSLSLPGLLRLTQGVETSLGRVRTRRWGARTIDIDIVAAGESTWCEDDLVVPHPRAHERDFVLAPWLRVDPDAELPGHGHVADLLARTPVTWCRPPEWWRH